MTFASRTQRLPAGVAGLAAGLLLALPIPSAATDIAWSAERISATMASGRRTTESQAVFKTGEKARVHSECQSGPTDDKGWATMKCESDFTFADGSHIFMSVDSRHDEKTLASNATGTFKGGTQRFEGISGSATGVGLTGRMQWTGAYSVPAKK